MDNKAFCKATKSSILMLPDELLTSILGKLPFKCKAICHVVSRRFNKLLGCPTSDLIWNRCDLCDFMPIAEASLLVRQACL